MGIFQIFVESFLLNIAMVQEEGRCVCMPHAQTLKNKVMRNFFWIFTLVVVRITKKVEVA